MVEGGFAGRGGGWRRVRADASAGRAAGGGRHHRDGSSSSCPAWGHRVQSTQPDEVWNPQRRVIGPGAMVGMGSVVTRDVPPFAKAYGNPCRVRGANAVGMTRGGLPQDAVDFLAAAYARGAVPDGQEPPPSLRAAWGWWRARVRG